jgi:uncharacterized protein (TIGR00251 family)
MAEEISQFVKKGVLKVFAKPGKKKTKVIDFNPVKKAVVIEVGAPAEENKANVELAKFLSRKLKRSVVMKSGFTSKEKVFLVS